MAITIIERKSFGAKIGKAFGKGVAKGIINYQKRKEQDRIFQNELAAQRQLMELSHQQRLQELAYQRKLEEEAARNAQENYRKLIEECDKLSAERERAGGHSEEKFEIKNQSKSSYQKTQASTNQPGQASNDSTIFLLGLASIFLIIVCSIKLNQSH